MNKGLADEAERERESEREEQAMAPYLLKNNKRTSLIVLFVLVWTRVFPTAELNGAVVWTRAEIERCVATKCVLRAPFNTLMTRREAKHALSAMRSFMRDEQQRLAQATPAVLRRAKHGTCAVVGGAALPEHVCERTQAQLVERADVIIRLNARYPALVRTQRGERTLGKRTHVLLLQRGALRQLHAMRYGWAQRNHSLSAQRRQAFTSFRNEAPALIYRHECPGAFGACLSAWQRLRRSARSLQRDVTLVHPLLETHAYAQLQQHSPPAARVAVPTTGVVAVLMALRACATVHVFAMNGSVPELAASSPHQRVWRGHNLVAERSLLRALHRRAALHLLS